MQPGDTTTPPNPADDTPEPATPGQENPSAAEASPWQYSPEDTAATYQQPTNTNPVDWTASEFIDNEKNAAWFTILIGITALAVVVIYFITHDLVTSAVIIIAAALFGVTAKRKPRTLQYRLDHAGVNIGGKPYPYSLFKSFAIMEEGAFNSILLMPLKRFMPPISLYFPPESEDQIIKTLGSYLPHEERSHDPVDRLMRKVRF